ncbi:MAG: glycosyltransferase [Cyanobacteria bacterium RM1_2_2]|nr:glycosyltransferase [Cyanobacteria bacterium RM1_2_2]
MLLEKKPTLSIITPVYNGERFIEKCIKVVIDQNCSQLEHIIVDGGSTDKTVEIIKQYAENYSHIRWISEKDQGQSDAMNKGIAMAKGHILGFLNVDDYYEQNVLDRVLKLFESLPEPTLLVGNCNIRNNEDRIRFVNKPRKLKLSDLLLGHTVNPFPMNPAAYFYHASLHKLAGLYSIEEHYTLDVDFLFRAVQVAHTQYVNEVWGNHLQLEGTKTFEDMKMVQARCALIGS